MKKTEYNVVNVFSNVSETQRKEKINRSIRTLCILDIEKMIEMDYNINIAFHSSVSNLQKGERNKC